MWFSFIWRMTHTMKHECNYVSDGWHIQWMQLWHIICSNFGSIQPASKAAVWSTSAKPAMSCSQAGATIYGVPTSVHSDGISQHDWEVEGHVGIEDEVAQQVSPKYFLVHKENRNRLMLNHLNVHKKGWGDLWHWCRSEAAVSCHLCWVGPWWAN